MISCKTGLIDEMTNQLQSVLVAKQNLYDLISCLFSKINEIKQTKELIIQKRHDQEEKVLAVMNDLSGIQQKKDEMELSLHECNEFVT